MVIAPKKAAAVAKPAPPAAAESRPAPPAPPAPPEPDLQPGDTYVGQAASVGTRAAFEAARPVLVLGHESLRAAVALTAPKSGVEPLTVLVGRAAKDEGDVVIDNANVSKRHAEIRFRGDCFFVFDLESANKTFVGGQQIPPRTEVALRSEGCVRFGPVSALFVADLPDAQRAVDTKKRVKAVERLFERGKITSRHRQDALAAEAKRERPEPGKRAPTAGEVLILGRAIDPEDWDEALRNVQVTEDVLGDVRRARFPRALAIVLLIAAVAAVSVWIGFTLAGRS